MFAPIRKLFAARAPRPSAPPKFTATLRLESLEYREVPAALSPPAFAGQIVVTEGEVKLTVEQARGYRVADYLKAHLGQKVGGGECAHIATEALRAAGADFTHGIVNGNKNDYDWGRDIARLTRGDQVAGKTFAVGDIVQYQNATFSGGGSSKLEHHTQVVAAVDGSGRITKVYEQNIAGNRTVMLRAAIDLTRLTGGSVSVYRPVARAVQSGLLEYTIVNNTKVDQNYTIQTGSKASPYTLQEKNHRDSFTAHTTTFYGAVTPTLKVGTVSVTIQNGAAYELYTTSGGQVSIRKL